MKTAEEILRNHKIIVADCGCEGCQALNNRYVAALEEYSSQFIQPPLHFWKRLEMFIENIQVNDPMSEEEKQMILSVTRKQAKR